MSKLPPVRRFASLFTALLVAISVLAFVPSPAGAVQTPESVVVNPDPADWTPNILDGQVNAILQMGSKVIVGGTFTQVRRAGFSQIFDRNFLFAFDMDTGVIDPNFVPVLNAEVEELTPGPDGTSVFVGGDFSTVNGLSYKKVVRLNLGDGSIVTSFKANTNGLVQDVLLRSGWLYVSGKFTLIKSTSRSGLARLDPVTGNVDPNLNLPFTNPLKGSLGVPEIDVTSGRLEARGDRQLQSGGGPVAAADRDPRPVHDAGDRLAVADHPVPRLRYERHDDVVRLGLLHLHARHRHLAGRLVLRRRDDGRVPREPALRLRQPLRADDNWPQPVPDVDGLDGRRHVVERERERHGGLRRRAHALDEQLVPRRHRRPGRGLPRRHRRALTGERDPLHRGTPPTSAGSGASPCRSRPTGSGWGATPTTRATSSTRRSRSSQPKGGVTPPPIVTYALPNDLYNLDLAGVGAMSRRSYDLTSFGSTSTVPLGIDWRNARGAFMLNGNLYYGWSDGWLYKRTFDGTNIGVQTQVPLNGLEVQPSTAFVIPGTTTRVPAFTTDIASMTGMFYDNGRIYYTVSKTGSASANNNKLYYRYFNPESEIVGASLFVASTGGEGVNWGNVRGMTLASGKLIYALTDGRLYRVDWAGTKPTGAVTQIDSATTWQSRGLFVYNQVTDTFAPSKPGHAERSELDVRLDRPELAGGRPTASRPP